MNLRGILFGGRMPNYHQYANGLTPKEYIEKVKLREISDPVLNFQLANDFHVKKVVKNYLKGDSESKEYAVILGWDNIYDEEPKKSAKTNKTVVRLGLVQWQMRLYKGITELMEQAKFFVDAVSGYRCNFALFPEFFNAPLMADYNHLSEADATRKLAGFTDKIRD